MSCLTAIVVVVILVLIAFSSSTDVDKITRNAYELLGSPTWSHNGVRTWEMPEFKLCIATDSKLPIQLYFTWEKEIIKPRDVMYKQLATVCNEFITYDIGSCKFTIKDTSLLGAVNTMERVKHQLEHL
jgi:hypothetical protein